MTDKDSGSSLCRPQRILVCLLTTPPLDPFEAIMAREAPLSAEEEAFVRNVSRDVREAMTRPLPPPSGLYGLSDTNRFCQDLFSKNRFTNAFPMALCSWMQDNGRGPVLVRAASKDSPRAWEETETTFEEALGLRSRIADCRIEFEQPLPSRAGHYFGEQPRFDVVIRDGDIEIGLENKLVVTPDDKTASKPEREHRPEAIFRPSTMQNAIMGLYLAMSPEQRARAVDTAKACGMLSNKDWSKKDTAILHQDGIVSFVDFMLDELHAIQRPLVAMSIWATRGTHNFLHDDAADVFIWTDLAFIDAVRSKATERSMDFPRWLRALARAVSAMVQLCLADRYDYQNAVTQGEGAQSDKELALDSGKIYQILKHPRAVSRIVPAEAVRTIIGENAPFSPERRLDQVLHIEAIIRATAIAALKRGVSINTTAAKE